ncbi:Probable M61 family peptidase precursor [Flavobacterium indicum GPTSA100-9 = DSM 17447]|uniref:Probable M61 family peptidase n=1 Tax=Flavobacterium indicum (strain DSM 17447 / CIP 109464 / GPTSA100-9) TaxID=1094466 RepID=H8XVR6_FLAIG|nr:peptidase M61 [Flavobacterium indicum]CCG54030.1 Probable M61 family peptidase precursor [Flavobacterium indicum GPTSA100-9 = DSM 17447]
MKKTLITLSFALFLMACKTTNVSTAKNNVDVSIDLVNVKDDKVQVTILPPTLTSETTTFHIPKIVPGTYSEDNYGRFIENVKAFDKKGNPLKVAKIDENSYTISEATKLAKVTYWVNDSFDTESGEGFGEGEDIFSPAGTNIKAGENFVINTHGFVGYFDDKKEVPYALEIKHPATLWGATSMVDANASNEIDVFNTSRYAELVDHPIMYSKPDYTEFNVEGMDIIISVYSPKGKYKAADITPETEKFMRAQKKFLGKFNANKKYTVLLYLSDVMAKDAKGFGALEHTTSTTVVMPEMMPLEALKEQLKDVVSHEFFHIVTPLSVHSREIHYFDYNNPKMSEHLWMYEGITEYFANLFQVNQGLITEDDFYKRMAGKIEQANSMNDKMSFTKMSKNVLNPPYKEQYLNVYQKGALIAMCIDIQMRELSNGKRGILSLMQDLSNEFGSNKPFNDEELFPTITKLTYPEIGAFLNKYVAGETPIPYDEYFAKMGVKNTKVQIPGNPFLKDQRKPYITVDQSTKEIKALADVSENIFMTTLGIKGDDHILAINGTDYNLDNIYDLIMSSESWKDGDEMTVKIRRAGKEQVLKGKVVLPKEEKDGFIAVDKSKEALKNAWLKG